MVGGSLGVGEFSSESNRTFNPEPNLTIIHEGRGSYGWGWGWGGGGGCLGVGSAVVIM